MNRERKRLVWYPLAAGIGGALAIFGIYVLFLSLLNSYLHVWQQYRLLQPWISILIAGFGIQMGLFSYVHQYRKVCALTGKETGAVVGSAGVTASGGISAGSMIACCAHHATDVLPLLGLTAASAFLAKYQFYFLGLGTVSNIAGIGWMLYLIRKHTLYQPDTIMEKIVTIGGRL